MYLWIFCTVDVISLLIQAIGGGMAAVAFEQTPAGDTSIGTNIMVAGIDFQLASVLVFSTLFILVIYRSVVVLRMPIFMQDRDMQLLVGSTTFAVILVIMRSIYRTIELAGGWSGYVIETERFFLALDGAPMAALVITYNIFPPGRFLNKIEDANRHDVEKPEQAVEA